MSRSDTLKEREAADLRTALGFLPPDALAEFESIADEIPAWRTDLLIEIAWGLYSEAIVPGDELEPVPEAHQHLDTIGRWYGLLLQVDLTDHDQMAATRVTYLRELGLVHEQVEQGMDPDEAWDRVIRGTAFCHQVAYTAEAIEAPVRVTKPKVPRLRLHEGGIRS